MSQLQAVRVRSQRTAAAAVERARLSLVPNRPSNAPRAPFAVLVFLILGLGVVGLLMFNTHMQQASFAATKLQNRADALQAKAEALQGKLAAKQDPRSLATAARKLRMVNPPNPAMLDLQTGHVLGIPVAAGPGDGMRQFQQLPPLPGALHPKPIVKKVLAPTNTAGTNTTDTAKSGSQGTHKSGNGPASPGSGTAAGTNSTQTTTATSGTGAPR